MCSGPRVEDDDDSRYVYEGFGPISPLASSERRRIQLVMRRIGHDLNDHRDEYGPLHDPMVLMVENLARTCQTTAELERRLDADAASADLRGAAAVLLRKVWRGYKIAPSS
jgi:hypothetical protein